MKISKISRFIFAMVLSICMVCTMGTSILWANEEFSVEPEPSSVAEDIDEYAEKPNADEVTPLKEKGETDEVGKILNEDRETLLEAAKEDGEYTELFFDKNNQKMLVGEKIYIDESPLYYVVDSNYPDGEKINITVIDVIVRGDAFECIKIDSAWEITAVKEGQSKVTIKYSVDGEIKTELAVLNASKTVYMIEFSFENNNDIALPGGTLNCSANIKKRIYNQKTDKITTPAAKEELR